MGIVVCCVRLVEVEVVEFFLKCYVDVFFVWGVSGVWVESVVVNGVISVKSVR